MLRGAHIGRTEAAGDVVLGGAGTAIAANQIRYMRRRDSVTPDTAVVVTERQLLAGAMALAAIAGDAGVQHGDGGESGVTGFGAADCRVADRTGLCARSGHVVARLGGAGPVRGVVAPGTVAGHFLWVAARQV